MRLADPPSLKHLLLASRTFVLLRSELVHFQSSEVETFIQVTFVICSFPATLSKLLPVPDASPGPIHTV